MSYFDNADKELKVDSMFKRSQGKKKLSTINYKERVFVLTPKQLQYYEGTPQVSWLHDLLVIGFSRYCIVYCIYGFIKLNTLLITSLFIISNMISFNLFYLSTHLLFKVYWKWETAYWRFSHHFVDLNWFSTLLFKAITYTFHCITN